MDISFQTDIAGYFIYRIYRETPDNVVYESQEKKNLVVDSGLKHLYTLSIPEVMRAIDFGNSGDEPVFSDTGIKGTAFNNSSIFNDLLAITLTGGPIEDTNTSEYTAFFRTKTTSSITTLREFAIKPGPNQDAFARQIFDPPIILEAGDGIEFTYKVVVNWPCEPENKTLKLSYLKNIESSQEIFSLNQAPLLWDSVSSNFNDKYWSSLASSNTLLVAVASADANESSDNSNIIFSTDLGETWSAGLNTNTDPITGSLNGITYGDLHNADNTFTSTYVAVGLSAIYVSNTGNIWDEINTDYKTNWVDVAYGKVSRTPSTDNPLSYTTKFIAIGNTGPYRCAQTTNGATWDVVDSNILNNIHWSAIAHGSYFVAIADSGTHRIAYSTDGENWLSAAAPALNEWQDIAYSYDKDLYVAVSKGATYSPIMYASGGDITKWYPAQTPNRGDWYGVTYGNGVFVAVGYNEFYTGAIYSNNGFDWQPVDFISFAEVWKSTTFLNNTFVAIASATSSNDRPFARSTVAPIGASTIDIDVKTGLITIPERVINTDSYMYTLREYDMPLTCSSTPVTSSELLYSTTLSYNSYAKSQCTLIEPNTAVATFVFDSNTGHGAIKNLLITDSILTSGYNLSGVWALELNVDDENLSESVVYTGDSDNIVTISPAEGSLTRSISSNIGDITNNTLTFNVYYTWGPDRSNIVTIPALTAINSDPRPFAIIEIPFWRCIDTDDFSNKYYSDYVRSNIALYQTDKEIDSGYYPCNGGETIRIPTSMNITINSHTIIDSISEPSYTASRLLFDPSSIIGSAPSVVGAEAIINALGTVNQGTSAQFVDELNLLQVNSEDIKTALNSSGRASGIQGDVVDEVEIIKEVNAKVKLIFNPNLQFLNYVNVIYNIVQEISDGTCQDESGSSIASPQLTTAQNTFYINRNL